LTSAERQGEESESIVGLRAEVVPRGESPI